MRKNSHIRGVVTAHVSTQDMAKAKLERLRRERDREIYRLYKEARDILPSATDTQLFNVVSVLPAPSFYMDGGSCAKFLSVLLRGGDLCDLPYWQRARYYALYRLHGLMVSQGRTEGRSLSDVAEELVGMPAPSFWLTPRWIREIVYRERGEERRRLYERVK